MEQLHQLITTKLTNMEIIIRKKQATSGAFYYAHKNYGIYKFLNKIGLTLPSYIEGTCAFESKEDVGIERCKEQAIQAVKPETTIKATEI